MINHARTLLLNISAEKTGAYDAGYEYVPPTYTPVELSGVLQTIYSALFGPQPDQRFLNFRVRELLSYIHQTELAAYVYALDPRVTYWPETTPDFFTFTRGVTVKQFHGQPRTLALSGDSDATTKNGATQQQFFIALAPALAVENFNALLAENTNFLTLENAVDLLLKENGVNSTAPTANTLYIKQINSTAAALTLSANTPAELPPTKLPNTDIKIKVNALATDPANAAAQWLLDIAANPQPVISSLLPTLELLGEVTFLELFGVAPKEPYATFKNLWLDHPLPAYRLAGFVLAYIYRLEALRGKNNG